MSILDNTTTSSGETDIEKHTPVIELVGDEAIVRVGGEEEPHPMTPEHRVDWVVFLDGGRVDIQRMSLANRPEARFTVYNRDSRLRAYACCNLHGLWESDDY
jgi:superoxide reductase